jgi:hypothetical protein
MASTVFKVAIGAGEIRVSCRPGPTPLIELRWFTPGAGPAAVLMPSREGLTFPVEDTAEVIEAIKAAELQHRRARLGGET